MEGDNSERVTATDAVSAYGSFHDAAFAAAARLAKVSEKAVQTVDRTASYYGGAFIGVGAALGLYSEGLYGLVKETTVGFAASAVAEVGVALAPVVSNTFIGAELGSEAGPIGAFIGAGAAGFATAYLGDRAVDLAKNYIVSHFLIDSNAYSTPYYGGLSVYGDEGFGNTPPEQAATNPTVNHDNTAGAPTPTAPDSFNEDDTAGAPTPTAPAPASPIPANDGPGASPSQIGPGDPASIQAAANAAQDAQQDADDDAGAASSPPGRPRRLTRPRACPLPGRPPTTARLFQPHPPL